MAIQCELTSGLRQYAKETERRMQVLNDQMQTLVMSQTACTETLWRELNNQADASRRAGFVGISRLCQQMQVCFQEVQENRPERLPAEANAMMKVCRAIRSHALAVDTPHGCGGLSRGDGAEAYSCLALAPQSSLEGACLVGAD